MRLILYLWAAPMGFFWGWYLLSLNDLNFGTVFLSRDLHELVFRIYGQTLGVPAAEVPAMIAGACAFDTAIVMAIAAWRWRADWYPQTRAFIVSMVAGPAGLPDAPGPDAALAIGEGASTVPTDGSTHPAE